MKGFAVAFVVLLAGVLALPPQAEKLDKKISANDARFVGDLIASALENLSQDLRDAGLDPYTYEGFNLDYELPVPIIFNGKVNLDNLVVTGISNIVINHIDYGLLNSRLTLDISLPQITISVGDASFDVTILGTQFTGQSSSRLVVIEPRISGVVQMNVGVISGIFVRSIDLEFDLGGMRYEGNLKLFGQDYAGLINQLVSYNIPNALRNLREEVNQLVEYIAWSIVDQIL